MYLELTPTLLCHEVSVSLIKISSDTLILLVNLPYILEREATFP